MSLVPALLLLAAQDAAPRVFALEPGFEIAGHRILETEAGGAALLVLARDGHVRTFHPLAADPGGGLGELRLASPARTLLDLATFAGRTYLVAATPEGTLAHPLDARGVAAASAASWISRGRFGLRLAAPAFTRIVQDVNRDGLSDILVPTLAGVELWLASLEPDQPPRFRKAATVAVEIQRGASHDGAALSDSLTSSLSIPGLDTADVNGDARPDLLVVQEGRRSWHLQRADASFPLEPDVALDLAIFQDTTPAASTRFGGTLASDEGARFQSRDLDGDDVPDYVIAHRRKVWVFRGGPAGPQFTEPSAILKTSEDSTALLLQPLDEDERPDLLLLKVQVPTLATLLRGLFAEWDVDIRALGYRNAGQGTFETSPSLSNDLALRLPGIVGLLKNPEQLTERFDELEQRFRGGARGDVDGDGAEDVLLVTPDGKALELWLGQPARPDENRERWLRALLFDEPGAVWDIERTLTALGSLADRQVALATGNRSADRRFELRDPALAEVLGLECADFDADGGCEVVIAWRSLADARVNGFDVLDFGRED